LRRVRMGRTSARRTTDRRRRARAARLRHGCRCGTRASLSRPRSHGIPDRHAHTSAERKRSTTERAPCFGLVLQWAHPFAQLAVDGAGETALKVIANFAALEATHNPDHGVRRAGFTRARSVVRSQVRPLFFVEAARS